MRCIANVTLASCLLVFVAAPLGAEPIQWVGNGHWYEVVVPPSGGIMWDEASQAAQGRIWMGTSGHLATITSQGEQDFVATLLGTYSCWLAGYQDPKTSPPAADWHWQISEPWAYTNWQPNEPNDYYGEESCLLIYNFGKWNDYRCIELSPYLVEYDGLTPVETTTWGSIKMLYER